MAPEALHYVAGRIQQRLAEDPRTAELGVRVDAHPDAVYLRGPVADEDRREAVIRVARETEPDWEIRDELTVTPVGEPGEREDLS